jgi:aminopeptidase-like protein
VDWYKDREGHMAFFSVMDRIDGTRSIADIAREIGVGFDAVRRVAAELASRGLVSYR